jgi:ABC-type Fe3+-hydroxamate transport system substrate-binding protein
VRVVSLVPSATETLLRWGVEPVACTRFCEQPSLNHVGGTKDPDIAAITGLAPDLVVMCDQENRADDVAAIRAAGLSIHVIHLLDAAENGPEMDRLAAALARPDLMGSCDLPGGGDVPPVRLRAFVPIWRRPWMTINADTYASTLLRRLGIGNVAAPSPDRYPTLEPSEIHALAPNVVLAPSEPYPFSERHRVVLEEFAPVVFVDGQDLFWWGARAPEAARRLAAALA